MKSNQIQITHKELTEILNYNKDSGIFTFKVSTARCIKVGDIAGSVTSQGYIRINIRGNSYFAHRLALFYVTKKKPNINKVVDHINHNRLDNSYANLRLVTLSCNQKNQTKSWGNTGYFGICKRNRRKPYQVTIFGKFIGCFFTLKEALSERKKAELKHNFHSNHGS